MMAAGQRKAPKKYKFELTRSAIGGIGVVCFCIFLWMFLLGVWTGQSLLMPSSVEHKLGESIEYQLGDERQEIVNLSEQKKTRPE